MRILSLFDGMACGMIAMQLAGVDVESYDAYEIDKYAVKTAQHNFPMIQERGDVFAADFTQYGGVDFLVGGSPCTYWSIAQTKNRETVASGMGWELFSQYVRALREAKPKYFIYENNKSMSKQIRASIDDAFGFEAVLINSALVSAQNRQRLYWVGKRNADGTYSKVNVEQPEDRGILLKDVLDSAVAKDLTSNDKAYTLTASYDGAAAWNTIERHQRNMVAEPINITADGKSQCLRSTCYKDGIRNIVGNDVDRKTGVAETVCLQEQLYGRKPQPDGSYDRRYEARTDGKSGTLTQSMRQEAVAEPVCVAQRGRKFANLTTGSCCRQQNVLIEKTEKTQLDIGKPQAFCNKIYEVRDGQITIKGKRYPIKLRDGFYIIRKLTVSECKRLQTVPEWYDFSCVSNSQAYKMLGNGWTCEVIKHLIDSCLNEKETDFDEQCRWF